MCIGCSRCCVCLLMLFCRCERLCRVGSCNVSSFGLWYRVSMVFSVVRFILFMCSVCLSGLWLICVIRLVWLVMILVWGLFSSLLLLNEIRLVLVVSVFCMVGLCGRLKVVRLYRLLLFRFIISGRLCLCVIVVIVVVLILVVKLVIV